VSGIPVCSSPATLYHPPYVHPDTIWTNGIRQMPLRIYPA